MNARRRDRRIVPVSIGLAMLALVVAAGLTPNVGVVAAQTNCAYGQCPASPTFPTWAVALSVGVVVVALLVALLLLRRRKGKPGAPEGRPEWSEGTAGSAGYTEPPTAPPEWTESGPGDTEDPGSVWSRP